MTPIPNKPTTNVPIAYSLEQNYPNPFNPETRIQFDVPQNNVRVVIHIYDTQGRRVRTLVDNSVSAGSYHILWDGRTDAGLKVTSGIYLYSMHAGHFHSVRKMILTK